MKILFAGGGTAGHINPALSIADYIKENDENFEALFVGTQRGLEKKLVPASGYKITYIDICGFNRKKLLKNISVLYKLYKARLDSKKILREFCPDAVVCTGGYVSGPVLMAAKSLKIPSIIHEQNVYPGLTVRGSEKYVDCVAVSFSETVEMMKDKGKCVVTGNPIRPEILRADRESARRELGVGDKPFVLVFGGSLGAEKINNTMLGVINKLSKTNDFTLLFGTGDRNYQKVMAKLEAEGIALSDNIKIVPYINNMSSVMAAADVVVARSGAITVSEICAMGKPSVLIPSPNVVRNHQEQNARALENKNAAVVITEDILSDELLYSKIIELVSDNTALSEMGQCAKTMAKTNATEEIFNIVKKIIK